jgi:hypothetical protein
MEITSSHVTFLHWKNNSENSRKIYYNSLSVINGEFSQYASMLRHKMSHHLSPLNNISKNSRKYSFQWLRRSSGLARRQQRVTQRWPSPAWLGLDGEVGCSEGGGNGHEMTTGARCWRKSVPAMCELTGRWHGVHSTWGFKQRQRSAPATRWHFSG